MKKTIIITSTIIALVLIILWQFQIIRNKNVEIKSSQNLIIALNDSLTTSKNSIGELTYHKAVLQADLKDLEEIYSSLSTSQQDLFKRLKTANKKNNILQAALVQMQVKIDTLTSVKPAVIDSVNHTLTFSDSLQDLNYKIKIFGVKPLENFEKKLLIESLELPNKQFITFNYDKKNSKKVLSFSISNSNKYFQVNDVQAYSIPNKKERLSKLQVFGIGLGIGIISVLLIK